MLRIGTVCAAGILGIALLSVSARPQGGELQDIITLHEQKLADARSSETARPSQGAELLAAIYRETGSLQKALDYCNQSVTLEQNAASVPAK